MDVWVERGPYTSQDPGHALPTAGVMVILRLLRWILEEVGHWVGCVALFAAVLYLTGRAEGSAWKTILYLAPLVAGIVGVIVWRSNRAGADEDQESTG